MFFSGLGGWGWGVITQTSWIFKCCSKYMCERIYKVKNWILGARNPNVVQSIDD